MGEVNDPELPRLVLTHVIQLLGLDGKGFAKRAGVDPSLISRYLSGDRTLSRSTLEDLMGAAGVRPALLERMVDLSAAFRSGGPAPAPGGVLTAVAEDLAAELGERFFALGVAVARQVLSTLPPRAGGWALAAPRPSLADLETGEGLFASLEGNPETGRLLVEVSLEYRHWALCRRCCEESIATAADDPRRALEWAELARSVAELVHGDPAWRSRLQGHAWAHVGNARRALGELREAAPAFALANRLWGAGSGCELKLLEEGLLPGLEASLRKDQRRLQEALKLLGSALAVAETGLKPHLLVNKANVLNLQMDCESAIAVLDEALPLVEAAGQPRLRYAHVFAKADALFYLERPAEAEALLPELRALTAEIGNDLDGWRLRWLEGRVAAGLGRRQEAIGILALVRREFARREIPYDTALATLELAVLHLEEGDTAEVKRLAAEMKPIFEIQGVPGEALAALTLFTAAAKKEKVTVAWARNLVRYLYRAQGDPELRFEASA